MRPLCLCLLLAARLLPAADAALPDFLPANTKVMMGVRLRAITGSPLFQGIATQAMNSGSDWMTMASMIGFDPLKDIDEILIATSAERQNAPALMVVSGHFNVERLAAGAKRYHGVPLLSVTKGSNSLTALLSDTTAIAGDAAIVRAAIDHRGSPLDSAFAERVESLRSRYDIWGVGDVPPGFKSPAGQAPGLDSVDRFQFGLLLSHGIEASAELHARSAEDIQKLAASVQLIKAAVANQPNRAPVAVKLDTQVEGNTLKLSLAIPEEELRKAIQSRATAFRPAPAGGAVTITGNPATAHPTTNASGDTVVLTLPGKR
jgi:hypothetical protein